MTTDEQVDDAIQEYLTECCYGPGRHPDGLMIAAEAGWTLMRRELARLTAAEKWQAGEIARLREALEDCGTEARVMLYDRKHSVRVSNGLEAITEYVSEALAAGEPAGEGGAQQ